MFRAADRFRAELKKFFTGGAEVRAAVFFLLRACNFRRARYYKQDCQSFRGDVNNGSTRDDQSVRDHVDQHDGRVHRANLVELPDSTDSHRRPDQTERGSRRRSTENCRASSASRKSSARVSEVLRYRGMPSESRNTPSSCSTFSRSIPSSRHPAVISAVRAPSRDSRSRGDSSACTPIFPAEM